MEPSLERQEKPPTKLFFFPPPIPGRFFEKAFEAQTAAMLPALLFSVLLSAAAEEPFWASEALREKGVETWKEQWWWGVFKLVFGLCLDFWVRFLMGFCEFPCFYSFIC